MRQHYFLKVYHEINEASSLLILQCPFRNAFQTVDTVMKKMETPALMVKEDKTMLKSFDEIPGPKGLPLVGTLFEYFKKDGLSFDKMFEVRLYLLYFFSFRIVLLVALRMVNQRVKLNLFRLTYNKHVNKANKEAFILICII